MRIRKIWILNTKRKSFPKWKMRICKWLGVTPKIPYTITDVRLELDRILVLNNDVVMAGSSNKKWIVTSNSEKHIDIRNTSPVYDEDIIFTIGSVVISVSRPFPESNISSEKKKEFDDTLN